MQNLQGLFAIGQSDLIYDCQKDLSHQRWRQSPREGGRQQVRKPPARPSAPGGPENPHVCVLNPAGLVPGQGAFTNPQVDDLQSFGLLSLAELKRKDAPFSRASRTKGARNSPSQVRMPAPGAALPSARSIRPTMPQAPAAPSPPHSQAPATSSPSRHSACRPWPQCPRHLRIPYRRTSVTHRLPHTAPPCTRGFPRNCMQCNLVPHSFQPSAPSAYGIQPTAPQAPSTFGPPRPKRLQHPAHRLPHNARPCTRGFPRSCVRCNLVLHSFQPTAPTGAACQTRRPSPLRFPTQRPGHLRHAKRHAPSLLRFPAQHAERSLPLRCDLVEQPGA